jgi:HlyD family secretion protein
MLPFLRKYKLWVIVSACLVVALTAGAIYLRQTKVAAAAQDTTQMQTATARVGSLVLSASGSGVVIPASQTELAFTSGGTLLELTVKVGDTVHAGQLLARVDDSNARRALTQAEIALRELTSASAVATARQAAGDAETAVQTAHDDLAYVISPLVLKWEERVQSAQQAADAAAAAAQQAPSADATSAVNAAQVTLKHAQASLQYAKNEYRDYLQAHFTFKVQQGHDFVEVYSPPSAAEIEAARAALDLARAKQLEAQWLYAELTGGDVPADASGSALAQVQQARLAYAEAQQTLDSCRLVAPAAGTVTSIAATVGQNVGTSTFITLVDMQRVSLNVYFDETDLDKVKVGNAIEATFDAFPDQVFNGTISAVDPTVSTSMGSSTVHATATLDQAAGTAAPRLLLGMNASIDVIAGKAENAVLVPVEALRELAPGSYAVFVVENGTPKLRTVTVGLKDVTFAQITSGLSAGDVVSTGLVETQ